MGLWLWVLSSGFERGGDVAGTGFLAVSRPTAGTRQESDFYLLMMWMTER